MKRFTVLLNWLLPEDRAGAILADYEDFRREEGPHRMRVMLYALDLFCYALESAGKRRLALLARGVRCETRGDPFVYAGLLSLLPQLYLITGLALYFSTGGGVWLAFSRHYPLELHEPVALLFALSLLPPIGFLGASLVLHRSLLRRRPQLLLGLSAWTLGVIVQYAAYF